MRASPLIPLILEPVELLELMKWAWWRLSVPIFSLIENGLGTIRIWRLLHSVTLNRAPSLVHPPHRSKGAALLLPVRQNSPCSLSRCWGVLLVWPWNACLCPDCGNFGRTPSISDFSMWAYMRLYEPYLSSCLRFVSCQSTHKNMQPSNRVSMPDIPDIASCCGSWQHWTSVVQGLNGSNTNKHFDLAMHSCQL